MDHSLVEQMFLGTAYVWAVAWGVRTVIRIIRYAR